MLQYIFGNDKVSQQMGTLAVGAASLAAAIALYSRLTSGDSNDQVQSESNPKIAPYLPSKIPFVGNMLEMVEKSECFHDWLADILLPQDGSPFMLSLPGRGDMFVTAKPEHYEEILKRQADNFIKSDHQHEVHFDFVGEAVVFANGDAWKYQHRLFVSLFSANALKNHMTPVLQRKTLELQRVFARAAATQQPLDAFKMMQRFTLEAFAEIGLGYEMDSLASDYEHPFEEALEMAHYVASYRFKSPQFMWKIKRFLNVGTEKQLRDAMSVINELVMDVIAKGMERKRHENEDATLPKHRDVVSMLLDHRDDNGKPLELAQIRSIALTAIIAGKDTSGDTMSWLLHMLSENPSVEKKLRTELLDKLPKLATTEEYIPSGEDVQGLTYLEAVIREVLRLFPPAPFLGDEARCDTVFPDGTLLPAGTAVGLSLYTTGRMTSVWGPDAAEFVPERFLDPETGELVQVSPTKLCAFRAGPRACVGRRLAMLEIKIAMACIVGRFHLIKAHDKEMTYAQSMTIGMKYPLMMRVEPVGMTNEVESVRGQAVAA